MTNVNIRPCDITDLKILKKVGIETFTATFAAQNTPENMQAYLSQAYTDEKLTNEITTPGSTFYLLIESETAEIAGYLKLNVAVAQTETIANNSLEIERIYLRQAFQKQGLGRKMLEFALQQARTLGMSAVWLGVWEHNENAKAFYQKLGFHQVSQHSFLLGADCQTDLILLKEL